MKAMDCKNIIFTGHAIRQMFQRTIGKDDVSEVIKNGETILDYPDDTPLPSMLLLGFIKKRPIHVVIAYDAIENTGYVITAYEPDLKLWTKDFRRRI